MDRFFVSRARYDEMVARVKELEAERKTLTDRLLVASGIQPLYTAREIATPLPPVERVAADPQAEKNDIQPINRPSREQLKRIAERAKNGH